RTALAGACAPPSFLLLAPRNSISFSCSSVTSSKLMRTPPGLLLAPRMGEQLTWNERSFPSPSPRHTRALRCGLPSSSDIVQGYSDCVRCLPSGLTHEKSDVGRPVSFSASLFTTEANAWLASTI